MALTPIQIDLLRHLRSAAAAGRDRRLVYRSERLGYLPYGLYHWVVVGGRDVSLALPDGWGYDDLQALADAGHLTKVDEWQDPADEYDRRITYEITPADRQP